VYLTANSAVRYTQSPGLSAPETYLGRDRAPSSRESAATDASRVVINPLIYLRYRRGGGAKRSPMPDLYIGAHAAITGYRLLTRDVRRYPTYFPTIDIIAPPQAENETA
jgi:hypothetical protein